MELLLMTLLQDSGGGMIAILMNLVSLAIAVLAIAGWWKIFSKAGQPGWAAIVPIYNVYIMLVIAKKPAWWLVGILCAPVLLVFMILACIEIAKGFGKGAGYGVGLVLLGFVFAPMLGFSDAQWNPPSA